MTERKTQSRPSELRCPWFGTAEDIRSKLTRALLERLEVQRMTESRLLGALDYLDHDSGSANRWEHSVGVAVLAEALAEENGVSGSAFDAFSAAALLHDIGVAPLQTTLQSLYTQLFAHSSEKWTIDLVLGERTLTGSDNLSDFIRKCGAAPEEVAAYLEGGEKLSELIYGPKSIPHCDFVLRCAHSRRMPETFTLSAEEMQSSSKAWDDVDQLRDILFLRHVYSERAFVFERAVTLVSIRVLLNVGDKVTDIFESEFAERIGLLQFAEKFRMLWPELRKVPTPNDLAEVKSDILSTYEALFESRLNELPPEQTVEVNGRLFAELVGAPD